MYKNRIQLLSLLETVRTGLNHMSPEREDCIDDDLAESCHFIRTDKQAHERGYSAEKEVLP